MDMFIVYVYICEYLCCVVYGTIEVLWDPDICGIPSLVLFLMKVCIKIHILLFTFNFLHKSWKMKAFYFVMLGK